MALKCTKCLLNIPTSSIASPSKIYPKWYFCFENIPSGNTASTIECFFVNHPTPPQKRKLFKRIYGTRTQNNFTILKLKDAALKLKRKADGSSCSET
jgi:hypothetical protein